jgi:toxin ParE1/3/4
LGSIDTWDKAQADRYLSLLETCCRLVASNPGVARKCDEVRPGYRRIEESSQVLFFKFDALGALGS